MSASRQILAALVAAGMDAIDAAGLMAQSAVEMSPPADTGSAAAKRQAAWRERNKASQSVTKRLADETSQSVTEHNKPSQSNALSQTPISNSKNLKSRERQNRGTRLAADWSPCEADRAFAKQEGFSEFEINREANKFRDYWAAAAGAKGIKLDWAATWRQWIRNGAERAGKTPPASPNGAAAGVGYYAKPDSEQITAWDAYSIKTTGKSMPRDKNQGWHVKSEWPPDHGLLPLKSNSPGAYQQAGE